MEQQALFISKPWWKERPYVTFGVIASVLLHLVVIFSISAPVPVHHPEPLVIDIILPPRPQPKQIVSTPDRVDPRPPEIPTQNRSEVDTRADKEQIKRGDDPHAGKVLSKEPGPKPPTAESEQKKQSQQKVATPKPPTPAPRPLKELLLDNATSLSEFGKSPEKKDKDKTDPLNQTAPVAPSSYQPFSRPSGSGAQFLGSRGASDFLPNLPDGDITLLNAKADQFAVFVRRVAAQVFSDLRQSGWESLSAADIYSMNDFCTVKAVMSLDGKLLSVRVLEGSGSARFDTILSMAAKSGTKDRNPPPAAATTDGTIHFIFQARSWVRGAVAARTGAPIERRWLLLGTGLE